MKNRKKFSIEEANALLPQLEIILSRLMKKKEMLDRLHDEHFISELLHEATQNRLVQPENGNVRLESGAQDVDAGVSDLETDLVEVRSFGCILRNLDAGWVEFPANLKGEVIYLCWKRGESSVRYYRPRHAAFVERLPL